MKPEELKPNRIYAVTWSGPTLIVGRYKEESPMGCCQHTFYDCLHYWNAHENFYKEQTVYLSNVEEIREASQAEKYLLVQYEIRNNLI